MRFYNNKEYLTHLNIVAVATGAIAAMDYDDEIGTYTGDPTKDGKLKMTATKELDKDEEKLVDVETKTTDEVEIKDGKVELDLNADGEFDEFEIDTFDVTLSRQ